MKKMDKKAFTIIELLVVIAVVGILVLLGAPRFTGYTQKAELTRVQHDTKVMEEEIGTVLINGDDDFNKWENNINDLNQLAQDNELFEKEGFATVVEPTDGPYKVIPEKYKDKINTKLKGTFYANSDGKVYYEHGKGPGYSDEEIEDLKNKGFIPVADAEELNNVRNATIETYGKGTKWEGEYLGGLDKKYVQVKNIDLSEYSGEGWIPIGTGTGPNEEELNFTGTYDGGTYVITGLEVKGDGENYKGLFGRTEGATISNVGLIDSIVTGEEYVGGLVGAASYSTISNSYAAGSVTGTYGNIGGLVGWAGRTNIDNSYAEGSVTGIEGPIKASWYVGGLVGRMSNHTTISNSYATGSVEVERPGSMVGGLVGLAWSSTKIINSYATGDVTGGGDVGGLVGESDAITIENSYATGSVTGSSYVGGLVGKAYSRSSLSSSYTKIIKSYATGSVTGTGERVGGLVGTAENRTDISNSYATGSVKGSSRVGGLVGLATNTIKISNSYATGPVTRSWSDYVGGLAGNANPETKIINSYWDINTTGQASSYGGGGEGKTTNDMMKQTTYSGWDFDTVWKIDDGKYPTLR